MKKITLIIFVVALLFSCGPGPKIQQDPFYSSFLEKTRLIMTKEELEIYRHLPDPESKRKFIKEFWEIRDPDPQTKINENRLEFERRIMLANKWFRGGGMNRGWNTDRGRILLLLGEADRRERNLFLNRPGSTQTIEAERWIYFDFQLALLFFNTSGVGEYKLLDPPPGLITAIDESKFQVDLRNPSRKGRGAFKFDLSYKNNKVTVKIPTKRVSFKEEGGKMTAAFKINVVIYLDFKKIDSLEKRETISRDEEQLLNEKFLFLEFTVPVEAEGKYFLDVIIEEEGSNARYRQIVKFKKK